MRSVWLEQYQLADSDETVSEALLESDHSPSLKKELRAIEGRMADPAVYESPEYSTVMERYNRPQSEAARSSGACVLNGARILLEKLAARDVEMSARIRDLSGGERHKVAVDRVLAAADSMDIFLLDEPTNHLDLSSRVAIGWP